MNKILLSAALAVSAAMISTSVAAQQRGAILTVDSDRIMGECTACTAAATQLQQRQTTARSRAQQLQQQIQTEGKPLQDSIDALKGKDPDAALQQRITAFQARERSAQQEVATLQRTYDSTVSNVQQQIAAKLVTVVEQVRARHGATVVLSKNATIASDGAADVTAEALAALNQALPSVTVAPLAQPQQPQGR